MGHYESHQQEAQAERERAMDAMLSVSKERQESGDDKLLARKLKELEG